MSPTPSYRRALACLAATIAFGTAPQASSSETTAGNGIGCQLQVLNQSTAAGNDYNALATGDHVQRLSYRIRNIGSDACVGEVRLQASKGDAALVHPQGDRLDYVVVLPRQGTRQIYDSQTDIGAAISIALEPGRFLMFEPDLIVQRGQAGLSGEYRADIDVEFLPTGAFGFSTRERADIELRVGAVVQANFTRVDRNIFNGGQSVIELGRLKPGMSRLFGMQLRSNADVDVKISSLSGGVLRNSQFDGAEIGYTLFVDDQVIALDAPRATQLPASLGTEGQTTPMTIALEHFGDKPAGRYGDVIRVHITAR